MSPKPPGPAEPWQPRGGPEQRHSKPKPAAARPGGSSQAGERKAAAQAARSPAESSAQKQPTPLHMVRRRGREPVPRAAPAPATGTGTDSIGGAAARPRSRRGAERPPGPGAGPAALPAPPARRLRAAPPPPNGARLRPGAVATPAAGGVGRGSPAGGAAPRHLRARSEGLRRFVAGARGSPPAERLRRVAVCGVSSGIFSAESAAAPGLHLPGGGGGSLLCNPAQLICGHSSRIGKGFWNARAGRTPGARSGRPQRGSGRRSGDGVTTAPCWFPYRA